MLRCWRLNEYEWWAANSLEEALADYQATTGEEGESAIDDLYFAELDESDLDEPLEIEPGADRWITIRDLVAAMDKPGFVCGIDC